MFSFLKRFFGNMVRKVQNLPVEPDQAALQETPPAAASVVARPAEPARAPVIDVETPPAAVFVPAPAFTPEPAAAFAPATITDEFLRGSVFDDDEEEEILPGDKPNLGMVPSIGNPNAYMIGLVGEDQHREAVNSLTEGMPITLQLEPDNPHDPSAIAAVDRYGRVIGYIGHDCWLREAVYGGGSGFSAWVLAVEMGDRGYREVVLEVEPSERPLRERSYQG